MVFKDVIIFFKDVLKMNKVFLTIDVEEWYHLDYLKKYNINKNNVATVPQVFDFLDVLDRLNIKATFFVLAELAYEYADIIRDIRDRGHEIGCHGLDHELLYEKTNEDFKLQAIKAKQILDEVLGCDVVKGYRASCFSMERGKLDILRNCGYKYDCSFIKFMQHPLYGNLDLSGFNKEEDLVYVNDKFYEFEVPTLDIGDFNLPISGGGYLRLFPYSLIKILLNKYYKKHDNLILYVHPFELTDTPLPFPKNVSFKDKFRATVGRRCNLKKLEKLLKMLIKKRAVFKTVEQGINSCDNTRGNDGLYFSNRM